jgi:hypothetical protein
MSMLTDSCVASAGLFQQFNKARPAAMGLLLLGHLRSLRGGKIAN